MLNGITTRSPGAIWVTAEPTSSTTPIASWPRMSPLPMNGPRTSYRCRSEPQIAVVVTRMTASVGSWMTGSGTSSTRTSRLPCHASAFIRDSPRRCCREVWATPHPANPTSAPAACRDPARLLQGVRAPREGGQDAFGVGEQAPVRRPAPRAAQPPVPYEVGHAVVDRGGLLQAPRHVPAGGVVGDGGVAALRADGLGGAFEQSGVRVRERLADQGRRVRVPFAVVGDVVERTDDGVDRGHDQAHRAQQRTVQVRRGRGTLQAAGVEPAALRAVLDRRGRVAQPAVQVVHAGLPLPY